MKLGTILSSSAMLLAIAGTVVGGIANKLELKNAVAKEVAKQFIRR